MLRTPFTELLGLRHPLVQAPMAGVAGGELAGAVAAAGALGMIGAGSATPPAWIGEQAERARTGGPFGVGLMVWALERRPELLEATLATRPAAVSLSFGDPAPWADAVHDAGARLLVQVQDPALARQALAAGADVVVAQGTEAGGHTGAMGTLPLLAVVRRLAAGSGVPVLAAGGIGDGPTMAAALAAGADGAWVGTRFAATAEALGSQTAKARIVAAGGDDTVLTSVFDVAQGIPWPPRFPGRALRNAFTDRWHGREDDLRAQGEAAARELADARRAEDYDVAYVYAGQAAGVVDDLPPAAELVGRLVAEAETALRRAAALQTR